MIRACVKTEIRFSLIFPVLLESSRLDVFKYQGKLI